VSHPVNTKWLEDRSCDPTRLTPAGESLRAQAPELLQALPSTRALMHGHTAALARQHGAAIWDNQDHD